MKKFLLVIAVLLGVFSSLLVLPAQGTYAAGSCSNEYTVLGLRPWYAGLVDTSTCEIDHSKFEGEKIQSSIWLIVMNLASDIMAIVGYLAIIMVIWGGYLYMMAKGDPGATAKGKKTITNALIGIAICMLASTVTSAFSDLMSKEDFERTNIFITAINHLLVWAGIISVIMVIFGGIQYVTSNGNPTQAQKARQTIMYSIIGLGIVIFSAAIVNLVVGAIG